MNREEKDLYIIDLIIQEKGEIYFSDDNDFQLFYDNPLTFEFKDTNNQPIILYIIYTKYNLFQKCIDMNVFEHININSQNSDGWSALMKVVEDTKTKVSIDVLKFLLNNDDINVNLQNSDGWSALMLSSRLTNSTSTEETVQLLLKHHDINVNLQNNELLTALIISSNYCEETNTTLSTENTVKMLLEHPDINVNLKDQDGTTALMAASKESNWCSTEKAVEMLLEHPDININEQDSNGNTALMLALYYPYFHASENTIKTLIKNSDTDINQQNHEGLTILMMAIMSSNEGDRSDIVKMLIENIDLDVSKKSINGYTTLELLLHKYKFKNIKEYKYLTSFFDKKEILHNMFYLHRLEDINDGDVYTKKNGKMLIGYKLQYLHYCSIISSSNNTECLQINRIREYMNCKRQNMIKYRRYRRKNILNKGY
jgi:ankyrin repeat protein